MAESGRIRREAYVAPYARIRTDADAKRNTEAGLTREQRTALDNWESRNRNYKTERAAVVDENGNVNPRGNIMVRRDRYGRMVEATSGSGSRVFINPARIPENSVLTHNHPSNNAGIAGRVGQAFSGADLRIAVVTNAKEIRAVTPNYVYSIKRPAKGWTFDRSIEYEADRLFERHYNQYLSQTRTMARNNTKRGGTWTRDDEDVYRNRIMVTANDRMMQELARKYGFRYTRRRSS